MTARSFSALTLVAAGGSALGGGVFLAFSTFVMRALDRLPAPEAIAAMQGINRYAPNPVFMGVLFGSGALCVPIAVHAVRGLDRPGAGAALAGSLVYLSGLAVTAAYHVPRNDALGRVVPAAVDAASVWSHYSSGWTAWNHVRLLTSVGGAALLAIASRAG